MCSVCGNKGSKFSKNTLEHRGDADVGGIGEEVVKGADGAAVVSQILFANLGKLDIGRVVDDERSRRIEGHIVKVGAAVCNGNLEPDEKGTRRLLEQRLGAARFAESARSVGRERAPAAAGRDAIS